MRKKTLAINADAKVTASSGNVFTDLGFGPGEAAVMGLRADLMARLRVLVAEEGGLRSRPQSTLASRNRA